MGKSQRKPNRYQEILEHIFFKHWKRGAKEFEFLRQEFEQAAQQLNITSVKNVGDVAYSVRFRTSLPQSILDTQPIGLEWVIVGAGKGKYRFRLAKETKIIPKQNLAKISIPEATPAIISAYALDDEQALLAIVRYNRLIDTFLGLTTYSLQNHLRTTVEDIGQIEIDELYIGIDRQGRHYVIPVQAKGGRDQIGIVQITQDLAFAAEKFPTLLCKAIAAQFMDGGVIALFELTLRDDEVTIVQERHYKLVRAQDLDL